MSRARTTIVARVAMSGVAACLVVSCDARQAPNAPEAPTSNVGSSSSATTLELSPAQLQLRVGDTAVLQSVARGKDGNVVSNVALAFVSNAASVATVSAAGHVTAVGVGNAAIVAQTGSVSATSIVQVLPVLPPPFVPVVTTVSVTPANATLDLGQSIQLTATSFDQRGEAMVGQSVVWSSSNKSVASVSSSGFVTALAPGGATITARNGTVSGTTAVTSAAPPFDVANQPAGFSMITNRGFNSLTKNCKDTTAAEGWTPDEECDWKNISIVQDSTAPRSPGNVLQAYYPAGTVGGTTNATPGRMVKVFSPMQQVYVSIWFKLSPNWIGNGTGTNKVFYLWMNNGPYFFMSAEGTGNGTLVATGRYQGPADAREAFPPNLASAPVPRGQWQHWEVVVKANSPGVANGEFHLWVNGAKVAQYTDVAFLGSSPSATAFMKMDVEPIWGGGGSTLPASQYMFVDNVYVSAR